MLPIHFTMGLVRNASSVSERQNHGFVSHFAFICSQGNYRRLLGSFAAIKERSPITGGECPASNIGKVSP